MAMRSVLMVGGPEHGKIRDTFGHCRAIVIPVGTPERFFDHTYNVQLFAINRDGKPKLLNAAVHEGVKKPWAKRFINYIIGVRPQLLVDPTLPS